MTDFTEFQNQPFGGLSTKYEVQQLTEAFGSPPENGKLITDSEIQSVIKTEPKTQRFKSVTDAWRRKMLRDYNCELLRETCIGFIAGTPSNRIHANEKRHEHMKRTATKILKRAQCVGDASLTEEEKRMKNHQISTSASIRHFIKEQDKQLKMDPMCSIKKLTP